MTGIHFSAERSAWVRRLGLWALTLVALVALAACGSDNTSSGSVSCTYDDQCEMGTVCSFAGQCVSASCDNCTSDQICYITEANPEGTCSRPECSPSNPCPEGQSCSGGLCQAGQGCTNADDCPGEQICNLAGQCTDPPEPQGCEDDGECETGEVCDNGNCVTAPPTSCDDVQCETGERCLPESLQCVRDCISDQSICTGDEVCDAATGQCSTPGCLNNAECPQGQECTDGNCVPTGNPGVCTQTCDANVPGTCGGGTPYCLDSCCSECVGAADCPQGQLCLDGFCGNPPDCSADPSVCPAGYTCNNGNCDPPQTGQGCDPSDPTSCPDGTFCDPGTNTCGGLGGDLGCGFCNADCTCPGQLVCEMVFCSGCNMLGGPDQQCPSGQLCLGLPGSSGICFPL
ncbi:MAG: hypothetical protein ACNA8W_02315 [Bradymonadaceae bacterium]